jgi:putative flippase GtrA
MISSGQKRIAVFAAIGATCFAIQLVVLTSLVHLGAYRPVANAVGFAISAQLNFLLSSQITWRDRPASGWRGRGARWLAYNGTALVSLGCNTAVFTLVYRTTGTTAAAAIGVLVGTFVVYLTCNLLVFRTLQGGAVQKPIAVLESEALRATDHDEPVTS